MSLLNNGDGSSPFFSLQKGASSKIFKAFKGYVKKNNLFNRNSSILVAVSGGPDSVFLLNLLILLSAKWDLHLVVAHFNHQLRGKEAERDAQFVEKLSIANNLEFFLGKGDVKEFSKQEKISIQEAARILRYNFLKKIKKEKKLEFIATGHIADDQAEEVLFRLIRGAGLEGICGIAPKRRDGIIRPILFVKKEQIFKHLQKFNIPYVTDETNLFTKYSRNKVRHFLIKTIQKELNPSIVDTLLRTTKLLQDDEQVLEDIANNLKGKAKVPLEPFGLKDVVAFNRKTLKSAYPAIRRRIFKQGLAELNFNERRLLSDHLLGIDRICVSNKPFNLYNLPDDFLALSCNELLFLIKGWSNIEKKLNNNPILNGITIKRPCIVQLGKDLGTIKVERIKIKKEFFFSTKSYIKPLYLDLSKVDFPLRIRNRRPGDKFIPLGFDFEVKVKDFFINRHVPRILRDYMPIFTKNGQILAICNLEIDERFKVEGEDALKIIWQPKGILAILQSTTICKG